MLGIQSMCLHLPDWACSAHESAVQIASSISKQLLCGFPNLQLTSALRFLTTSYHAVLEDGRM